MNIPEEIKKIDRALIDLILAGEFEMIKVDKYTTDIECGGVCLSFWMSNGAGSLATYSESRMDGRYYYHISEIQDKTELYIVLKAIKDPVQKALDLKKDRAEFNRLKLELGEV